MAKRILKAPALSWRARVDLLVFALMKRVRVPIEWPIHLEMGTVWLGNDSWLVDRLTFYEIFLAEEYRTDYRDAVVIDAGSHKGYYGAYALQRGARTVLSYEPEDANYAVLARTAAVFRKKGHSWQTHKAAVGGVGGFASLYITSDSWAHSLVPQNDAVPVVGMKNVPVIGMSQVLNEAMTWGTRVIAKLDIEGAECDAVLGTDPAIWRRVHEVFIETHAFAGCTASDLMDHFRRAEFSSARRIEGRNSLFHLAQNSSGKHFG